MSRVGVMMAVVALAVAGQAHASGGRGKAATHRVVRGDSLGKLAARYGVPLDRLAEANQIADSDRIRIGQVLVIPGGPVPVAARAPARAPEPLPSPEVVIGAGDSRHRVASGESLSVVARRYGTTVGELARANELADPDRIRAGEELVVPGAPWICPVQGPRRFTNDWGAGRGGGRRHLGTDLFAPRGTPVVASASGTVRHAPGARAGLAYYLQGDDGHTYYGAHLDALQPPGPVERGTVIGTVGSTGNASATAPHLHFELKPDGGDPVNPYFTLARWC
jgi:murein DD-endopeptidase MepM/ murein hydrolase activator NlpD